MSDLIERQAVLDLFQDNVSTLHNYARVWEAVEEMPSVTPTERTGHWTRHTRVEDVYDIAGVKTWGIKCQCDKCDFTTTVIEDFGYYNFCPNCGARMDGDAE